ncbi:multidrug efflux SMR transporter [Vagococcus fluvialis]|uniref:DMT family transporter n=1 Tax=Vagococcus fluvialis TaxID=2738 RepID=UPI0032E4D624
MNKNWVYVIVGGILEIFWVLCLKKSEGFNNLSFSIMTIILVIVSFYLFALGMENLPTGIAYTVFTGIGAVGTIVFGIVFLNESISTFKILFSVLLIIGILGLKMTSKEE